MTPSPKHQKAAEMLLGKMVVAGRIEAEAIAQAFDTIESDALERAASVADNEAAFCDDHASAYSAECAARSPHLAAGDVARTVADRIRKLKAQP